MTSKKDKPNKKTKSENKNLVEYIDGDIVSKIRELFDKVGKDDEFEFIFFSKKGRYLPLEKYINLLKIISKRTQKYRLADPHETLDIIYQPDDETSYRCTITNDIFNVMKKFSKSKNHVIFRTLVNFYSKKKENIELIKKEKKHDNTIDVDDFDFRVRSSKESKITKEELKTLLELDETTMNNIRFRFKQRTSLYIHESKDEFIRVDLTYTKTTNIYNRINKVFPNYELEIECNTTKPTDKLLNTMFNEAELLLKIVQQSNYIISRSDVNKILDNYRNLLSIESGTNISGLDARQAVTLEIQFLESLPNKYAVTDKADGERHFLIICDNKVYFISSNLDVKYSGITIQNKDYNNSMFDGELIFIPNKNRYIYLIFDCLFHKGQDKRMVLKLFERLSFADDVVKNCFVFEGHKDPEFKQNKTKKFDLNELCKFHSKQIERIVEELNHDIEINPKIPLIRRKYFIGAEGARDWEIFSYMSTLWNTYTIEKKVKCPYLLDGVIFQPLEQQYITNLHESKSKDYKWKPPEKNSIDFYIEFEKDEMGKINNVYDNSNSNFERNKIYRICKLFVGHKDKDKEVPILFREKQRMYDTYLFLDNDEVRDLDKNIISDKTVVEFYYNNDVAVNEKFRWTPIRTRYDKTESVLRFGKKYGNYVSVADKVWRSIINPLLISDFDDLGRGNNPDKNDYSYNKKMDQLKKKISHELIISASKENAYFQKITNLGKPMRNFHNWIKSNMIYTFCHQMYQNNRQLSVFDMACGRGGDIMKFYYSMTSMVVCGDIDRDGLVSAVDGAISRYNHDRYKKPNFPKMYFIQMDIAAPLDVESQKKALSINTFEGEEFFKKFFSSDPKKRTLFDRINLQFAIHYTLKNEDKWNNLKENINNHLRAGGYLLVSSFDAQKIRALLKGKEKFTQEYTGDDGKTTILFEIVKKYQDDKDDIVMETGHAIDVYLSWFSREGRYLTEYLVDPRYLIKSLKDDCDLDLVDSDSFENQYRIHEDYLLNYAKYEENPLTNKFLANVAEFYEESNINTGCREFNKLMRYYIFRKSDKETKQKGGSKEDSQVNFFDTKKFYVPNMQDYDNNYSCINSIHNILRNNQVIPKTITPEKLCTDLKMKFLDDNHIDLDHLTNKIIIEHQIENKKVKKVVDGLNIFVIERNCNDEFDVDLIRKNSKLSSNNLSVILMKDGTLYNPVYHIEHDKKIGIFDNKHDIVKKLMKEVN